MILVGSSIVLESSTEKSFVLFNNNLESVKFNMKCF